MGRGARLTALTDTCSEVPGPPAAQYTPTKTPKHPTWGAAPTAVSSFLCKACCSLRDISYFYRY